MTPNQHWIWWPRATNCRFLVNILKLLLPFSIPMCFFSKPQIAGLPLSYSLRITASSISILYLDTLEEKPNFSFHTCRQEVGHPHPNASKHFCWENRWNTIKPQAWQYETDPKMPFLRWHNMLHIISNNRGFTLKPIFFLAQFRSFMIRKRGKKDVAKEHVHI